MNQATLVGTVLEAELRSTDNSQVLKLRVKTPTVVARDEELKTFWDFHNVVLWGKAASLLHRELAEGSTVSVVGRITTRSYEKNGEKRWITEINASSVSPVAVGQTLPAEGES